MSSTSALYAQDTTRKSIGEIFLDDVLIGFEDGVSFISAPLRFTTRDWVVTAGLAGATGGLIAADADLKRRLGRETHRTTRHEFWDIPTQYGEVEYANAFAIAMYATGLFSGSDDIRITGRLLFESLTFAGGTALAVRYIAGRSRPYDDSTPWEFNGFQMNHRNQSFPSGHTVVAFAMSTVFAERIDQLWARALFYGAASLTAFASVHSKEHWTSDVFAGAAFGIAAGFHVVGREEVRRSGKRNEDTSRLDWHPIFPAGIRISYRPF